MSLYLMLLKDFLVVPTPTSRAFAKMLHKAIFLLQLCNLLLPTLQLQGFLPVIMVYDSAAIVA